MSQGLCRRKKLWSEKGRAELEALPLAWWACRRWQELLKLLDELDEPIAELSEAARKQAEAHPGAARLMTHPGVGPLTALSFALTIGQVDRFLHGREVSGYLGLDPKMNTSGQRTRLGAISKEGNSTTRWLLVEAGQTATRQDLRLVYRQESVAIEFSFNRTFAAIFASRSSIVRAGPGLATTSTFWPSGFSTPTC